MDFMIGSDDLAITARTTSGGEVPIFRAGSWVTEV
jgi:leucyl aminopeptidase (aminopeptidase T)